MKAKVNWIEKMRLEGETGSGHKIILDSAPSGNITFGPTPKVLILQALAGCTMMDVVSILQKQRKDIIKFWVDLDSELSNEHPKVFTKINVQYNFICSDLDEQTARRAIELSREKYCAVSNMLNKAAEITYTLTINKNLD